MSWHKHLCSVEGCGEETRCLGSCLEPYLRVRCRSCWVAAGAPKDGGEWDTPAERFRILAREALELLREHQACWVRGSHDFPWRECQHCDAHGVLGGDGTGPIAPLEHGPHCRLARVLRELEEACGS